MVEIFSRKQNTKANLWKKEPILTDWDIEFEPQPRPLLRSKSILMHMNKNKTNQKSNPPCQTKKNVFFSYVTSWSFGNICWKIFRPKKRLIILITYYSQYSCKKNQEENQKNHIVFIATKYNWSRTTTTLQNTYNITYYTICCTYYIHIKEKEKNIYDEIRQKTTTNSTAKTYYTWSPYTRSYTHDVIAYNNVTEKKTKLKLFVFWEKIKKHLCESWQNKEKNKNWSTQKWVSSLHFVIRLYPGAAHKGLKLLKRFTNLPWGQCHQFWIKWV